MARGTSNPFHGRNLGIYHATYRTNNATMVQEAIGLGYEVNILITGPFPDCVRETTSIIRIIHIERSAQNNRKAQSAPMKISQRAKLNQGISYSR